MSSRAIDMVGKRFGDVVAMRAAGPANGAKLKWICRCDCSNEFTTCGGKLRSGEVVTCPKCSSERVRKSRTKHGQRHSAEYRIWTHIKSRCFNPNVPEFENYGGRGITVCDEWRDSFTSFLTYMGPRPTPKHSIDRYPDNNGNYEPGNCRWATSKEQANNTRSNRKVAVSGEIKNSTQWADSIGVRREVIYKRLKRGVQGEKLLSKPFEAEKFTFGAINASIPEWSLRTGIKRATLYWRINDQKWPLEKALTTGAKL